MKPDGDTIDPISFMKNLGDLARESPGVANEVFGAKSEQLQTIAKAMAAGDSGELVISKPWERRLAGVRLDPAQIQRAATAGDLTASKLMALINAEKSAGEMYRNRILKAIGAGTLSGDSIKPSEFIRYFSTQGEPREVNQVLGMLRDRPDLVENIRRKTVQDIFDRAYPTAKAADNAAMIRGEPRTLDARKLQDALGDRTQRERYQSILGADTYHLLEQISSLLAPRGAIDATFQSAGGIGAGMQLNSLFRGGVLKYADSFIHHWLTATVYTHPGLAKLVVNQAIPDFNTARVTRALISSTPVVEALYKDFGMKKAQDVMAQMNASINRSEAEPKTGKKSDQELRDLLNQPVN